MHLLVYPWWGRGAAAETLRPPTSQSLPSFLPGKPPGWETRSLQQVLGLPRVRNAWNTSPGKCSGCIQRRRPSHLRWPLVVEVLQLSSRLHPGDLSLSLRECPAALWISDDDTDEGRSISKWRALSSGSSAPSSLELTDTPTKTHEMQMKAGSFRNFSVNFTSSMVWE